tara:strand:- start:9747 stop:10850 length:1104 start_codon:yes stop_codon:yes gene_type:complete
MKDLREYYYKSPGNPDRICEQITENIISDIAVNVDTDFKSDIYTIVNNQVSVVAGRIYCGEYRPDTEQIVKEVSETLGYTGKSRRFSSEAVRHINLIEFIDDVDRFPSSPFIKSYGYACDETIEGLPIGYIISREITHNILNLDYTGLDITTHVTVEYKKDIPYKIKTINIEYSLVDFEEDPKELLHDCEVLFNGKCDNYINMLDDNTKINTSCFGLGGPDTRVGSLVGTLIPTGFGMIRLYDFLGKSTNSVHRLSSLVARQGAKTISKTSMCNECLIEVSYGEENEPTTFNTKFNKVVGTPSFMESNLQDIFHFNKDELKDNFNLSELKNNIKNTDEYFGQQYLDDKDKNILPWERLNKIREFTPF